MPNPSTTPPVTTGASTETEETPALAEWKNARHHPAGWLLLAGALGCLLLPGIGGGAALALGAGAMLLAGENPLPCFSRRAAHGLLQAAVVALGAGMNLRIAWRLGLDGVGYTAIGIGAAFVLGHWLRRWLGLDRETALLISSGTAICGGSAIAAVSAITRPAHRATASALAVVFFFNALALYLFPLVGHALGLTQRQFGLWAALAIHDTSSVIGAGAAFGTEALLLATTVKLTRALWIIPLGIGLQWQRKSADLGAEEKAPVKQRRFAFRFPFPAFLLGFLATATLFTVFPALEPVRPLAQAGAQRLLTLALFFIGTGLTWRAVKEAGGKALAYGALLWALISLGTLGALQLGWIG